MAQRRDLTTLLPTGAPPPREREVDAQTLAALTPPEHVGADYWWSWVEDEAMPSLVAGSAQAQAAGELRSRRIAELRSWYEHELRVADLRQGDDDQLRQTERARLERTRRVVARLLAEWREQSAGSWWVSRRHEHTYDYIGRTLSQAR